MKPRGHSAVMNQRVEPTESLEFFPTPPWATRALASFVLPRLGYSLDQARVWEPAAGEGHMAEVLREYGASVHATDVHRYEHGRLDAVGSFVGEGLDVIRTPNFEYAARGAGFDFLITNPPFGLAEDFLARGLREAEVVALLVRTAWIESALRYERVFSKTPPICVAQFVERVPMVKGHWDPQASTATAYAWFVWARGASVETRLMWIPPGQRRALTKPDDVAKFARAA